MQPLIQFFLRKSELFVCTYPRKVLFGKCTTDGINEADAFIFDISQIIKLYEAIINVLNALRATQFIEKNEKICNQNCNTYSWKVSVDKVTFVNTSQKNETILSVDFDYYQLNELIYTLSESIISSLHLTDFENEFFDYFFSLDSDNLVELSRQNKFEMILKGTKFDKQSFKLFKLFKFYLDIIYIVSKLKLVCNKTFLPNNLEPLLKIV